MRHKFIIKLLFAVLSGVFCSLYSPVYAKKNSKIAVAAERFDEYLPLLQGKRVAFTGNNTSVVDGRHVVDVLKEKGVNIVKAFAPEHGFRGTADAGAKIHDQVDEKTGIPILSLYGSGMSKPTPEVLKDVDVLLFDIQDVGCRFYTYINTLQRIMEAGGENNIPVVVLDRPNPNGFFIDGPILLDSCRSGIGMQPVPIVYGMTIGEYAKMLNGEGWLKDGVKCDLTVIPCKGYDHSMRYSLPVPPSPNLPNDHAVNLYASTCLFEGTPLSEGRGTQWPFEVFGSPLIDSMATDFSFTPKPSYGDQKPKQNGLLCYGRDLRAEPEQKQVNLEYVIWAYNNYKDKDKFFLGTVGKPSRAFAIRAGNYELEQQIRSGMSPQQIRATWKQDLDEFKQIRKKYLLYKDF